MNAIPKPKQLPAQITEAERKRREDASKRADASLRLEGLAESAKAKAIGAEWERGEITSDEMIERIKALHVRRV